MPFFQFDSRNIFYDYNDTGKPTLLMLHGNSVSSKMFRSEAKFFSQYFSILLMDYPGLGQSDRIDHFRDDYWLYNSMAVKHLLLELQLKKVHIIGTSGGALTALNLATHCNEAISSIIADSFMGFGLSADESKKIVQRRTKAKSHILASAFWKDMNGDDWENVVDQDIDLMDRVGTKALKTISGDLSIISFPVLCVAAKTDELIPEIDKKVLEVADNIPNCQTVIFDFGKHPFMITQKEEFRNLAIDFYKKNSILS